MLHNKKPLTADNGVQVFLSEDIEQILFEYYLKDSKGSNVYSEMDILEDHQISKNELERMKHRLSYNYCHDENGKYKN
jgi:hypothetical protein